MTGRIDVHQHLVPAPYRDALARHGFRVPGWDPGWRLPSWDADRAVAFMDGAGIATGILSLSTPGTHFGDDAEARTLARRVNEEHAELVKDRPGRFGMFATVPLPDVDGALDTVAHAFDELGADGVVLLANYRGTYLGDPRFEPLMAELDRREAIVFVHPGALPGPPGGGIHPAVADFLLDTTRAVIGMVAHGVPDRHRRLRIFLSHAGGFVPYGAQRIAVLTGFRPDARDRVEDVLDTLSGFYIDTALSAGPTVLPGLMALARPGHVLFGSAWPYVPDDGVAYFTGLLGERSGLDLAARHAIERGSAEALFPRLAADASAATGSARPRRTVPQDQPVLSK